MERSEGGVVVMGRAEIDTRSPFTSVKQAVMLFGERVLAGELYANKLNQLRESASENGQVLQSRHGAVTTAELEETKQNLQKAREEGDMMADCLKCLREELEQTKRELMKLRSRDYDKQPPPDLKFLDNAAKIGGTDDDDDDDAEEFQKKRCVTFASPPSLARVINNRDSRNDGEEKEEVVQEKSPVQKKPKKKPLMPLVGRIFSRKRGSKTSNEL